MNIQTRHFGNLTIDEVKQIEFKDGIPGFEDLKSFALLEDEESEFCYLQSLEDGQVAFAVINPYLLKADYNPYIQEVYFEKLGGGENKEFALYTIVTVGKDLEQSTVNLQAPILIHAEHRLGLQVIVEDKNYQVRHKIVDLIKRGE